MFSENVVRPPIQQPMQRKRDRWNVTGECRVQLVETIPATLKAHNFAEDMLVEHMTTMEVICRTYYHNGGDVLKTNSKTAFVQLKHVCQKSP